MTRSTPLFAAIGALVFLATLSASAQDERPEPSPLAEALTAGHKAMLASNWEEAVGHYEKAKDAESGNADAYYFLACARLAQAQFDQAVSDFRTAISVAGAKRPDLHAKCLFNLAVLEETRKRSDAAKTAWQAYLSFANTHQDVPIFPDNAKQRIQAIEDAAARETEAQPVRQRIADREAKQGGGAGAKKIVGS